MIGQKEDNVFRIAKTNETPQNINEDIYVLHFKKSKKKMMQCNSVCCC